MPIWGRAGGERGFILGTCVIANDKSLDAAASNGGGTAAPLCSVITREAHLSYLIYPRLSRGAGGPLPLLLMNRTLARLRPLVDQMSGAATTSVLSTFSTCEISDALIKLQVAHGGYIPDIHMISPTASSDLRICSPAYTVKMVLGSDTTSPKLTEHFVDTAPAGSVVVIDAPSGTLLFPIRPI